MNQRAALNKLKRRYTTFRLVEIFLLSVAVGVFVFSFAQLMFRDSFAAILFSLAAGGVSLTIAVVHFRLHKLNIAFLTSYLNQHYPQLEQSADLLIADDNKLTSLQLIQKVRTARKFDSVVPEVRLPHRVFHFGGLFVASVIFFFVLSSFKSSFVEPAVSKLRVPIHSDSAKVFIRSSEITITPPAYTLQKLFTAQGYDLLVPEESAVMWKVNFSGMPSDAKIIFSGRDSAALELKSNYSFRRNIDRSGFYQLQWRDKNKTCRSGFYKIEAIKDQPPKVSIKGLDQFMKLKFSDRLDVEIKSELSDDYALSDAQIVATVSKGSGEGIKFREEKLRFSLPQKIVGRKIDARRTINLKKMELDPGDELYFYVEAWDNRTPTPNHSRTETFFIAVQDTATEITSVDSGLGVDLMPEYFRSQRQIIIDTEKLLREKKNLSKLVFNSTSNELGYDQKVLRLRYGQFLGLEDEAGIGQPESPVAEDEGEKEKDVTKSYGHQHDTKNEHNVVEQKNQKHDHNESKSDEEKEDPLKAFVHNHDNAEEATFFIQSMKTKLKAAVTEMWDAELYLRLYQPEKSLPYQYKALNLLKEISNDSRIYVHRSGFDPPPLKEEKRLTADLSEIKQPAWVTRTETEKKYPFIGKSILVIEKMLDKKIVITTVEDRTVFNKAGQELASLAEERPIIYLKTLDVLKSLADGIEMEPTRLTSLQKILWLAIPPETASPTRRQAASHLLNQSFLKSLDELSHE